MARKIEQLMLAGPAGKLEALLEEPEESEPAFAAVCCHPHPLHGGTMHNKVVYRLARGLRSAGGVVLRFNFRGVNLSEGEHAGGEGEVDDARTALDYLRGRYPELPFALAGFSFGSRVAHRIACAAPGPQFVVCAGMPAAYLQSGEFQSCATERIFVMSTNDQFAPRAEFQQGYDRLAAPRRLIWIEAEDHFFAGALDAFEEAVRQIPE